MTPFFIKWLFKCIGQPLFRSLAGEPSSQGTAHPNALSTRLLDNNHGETLRMQWYISTAAILITFGLTVHAGIFIASGAGESLSRETDGYTLFIPASDPSENVLSVIGYNNSSLNETEYLQLMQLIEVQYNEDLEYSSKILDEFVNKGIISREAMTATMTLFILTRETVDMVDRITPPSLYAEYHRIIQLALVNMEGYLWNMVKYYETNKKEYAMQAQNWFNESIKYSDNFIGSYNNTE